MPDRDQWNARYVDADTPWDLGDGSCVLGGVIDLGFLSGRDRVLVPGCGRGHDVLQLASRGFDAVGVDFAPLAIAALKEAAAHAELDVTGRAADIFDLEEDPAGSFDAIWEYTCLVALPPEQRQRYAALAAHLIRPGGRFVHAVFPTHRPPEAHRPPWPITPDEVVALFGDRWFEVLRTEPLVSPENRRGREELLILERR